jgi:hypothetical protein
MKEKTSITLSRDVLKDIDRLAGSKYSRSAVIEWAQISLDAFHRIAFVFQNKRT